MAKKEMDSKINQHKKMAMGEKITGMKSGGKVDCMKKGGKVKTAKKKGK